MTCKAAADPLEAICSLRTYVYIHTCVHVYIHVRMYVQYISFTYVEWWPDFPLHCVCTQAAEYLVKFIVRSRKQYDE